MQTLVFLLVLLFEANFCFAQSGNQPQTTNSYYTASINNPAQKCIEDICGPVEQSNLYMTKYMDRLTEYMQLATQDPKQTNYPPDILKLFADLKLENKKQSDAALAIFKKSSDMGSEQLDGFSKAIYNIMFASPYLTKVKYKASSADGKSSTSVDEIATASELKDLSAEDRAWIIKVAKYFANNFSLANNVFSESEINSKPPALLLKQLYPNTSISDAMKTELKKAQTAVASLKDLSPMEKALFFTKTSPDRINVIASHVANGTVDENETRELIQWNFSFKNSTSLFRNPDSPLLNRKTPTVEEVVTKAGGVDSIVKTFANDRLMDSYKDDGKIMACQSQYFLNKKLLPDRAQVENLKKDIKRSKKMVIETIKSKFPSSMHAKLIKSVEETDFIVPPTSAEFESSFSENIKRKIEAAKTSNNSLVEISPGEMKKLISTFTLFKNNQTNNNSQSDSNEFCDAFKYSPMSDANYTTYGSVILSFSTATGDESSRLKTIMHELGHSVSKAIADDSSSSKQLAGVRRCLADQHTEELPPQIKKAISEAKIKYPDMEVGPYVEEDFADTIAAESGKSIRGRNSWCQFMSLSYDKQKYQESNMQSDDGDTHSSSLFRLINFEMMKKGSIPDSCEKYFKTVKYTKHFSSCLDFTNPSSAVPLKSESVKGVR